MNHYYIRNRFSQIDYPISIISRFYFIWISTQCIGKLFAIFICYRNRICLYSCSIIQIRHSFYILSEEFINQLHLVNSFSLWIYCQCPLRYSIFPIICDIVYCFCQCSRCISCIATFPLGCSLSRFRFFTLRSKCSFILIFFRCFNIIF